MAEPDARAEGAPVELSEVQDRIGRAFSDLPRQLKPIARFVQERPEEVALNSLRGLASLAKAHPSNLMRLVRDLGFAGYSDFQAPFRRWLSARGASLVERVGDLQGRARSGRSEEVLADVVATEIANLHATLEQVDGATIVRAAAMMADARTLYIAGLRSLYPAAFLLDYNCRMLLGTSVLLGGNGGGAPADELRRIGPEDVLVAMSHYRYSKATLRMVQFAKASGARIICLTDSTLAPIAPLADIRLVASARSVSLLSSLAATVTVIEALVAALVTTAGERVNDGLARSRALFEAFDEFVED